MPKQLTSVVLLFTGDTESKDIFNTLDSIIDQPDNTFEIFIINTSNKSFPLSEYPNIKNTGNNIHEINNPETTLGQQLNAAFSELNSDFLLLIDNRSNPVILKSGAVNLFRLASKRVKNPGLIYADYELSEFQKKSEIHLLKPHIGRVRDNQDYGKVFFISTEAIRNIGYANTKLKFNTLYDLRLKLSAKYELVHIANRYAGSLYNIKAAAKSANVFDYLLASKESQIEAEEVLTSHLENINAKLQAGFNYTNRPAPSADAILKASVIIPVNNRPDFIGKAIESVQAQTVQEVEAIIVVNGGKKDPTIDAVKEYMPSGKKYDESKPEVRLLVYNINNLGLCLNMGAKHARGQYYVQLDSDDRLKKNAVEKIINVFDEDPRIGMVIGSYEVWEQKADGSVIRMKDLPVVTHDEWTEENGRNNLLRINGAGAPRSIPIELIRQIGFSVNEEPYCRNYGEDYGMVLKISERHRIGRVWDAIYEVIRHSGGTDHSIDQNTIDRNDEAKDFMRKEAIMRRIKINSVPK